MKKIKILIYLFISFFQKINSIQNEINCYFDNNYDLNQVTEIHPFRYNKIIIIYQFLLI